MITARTGPGPDTYVPHWLHNGGNLAWPVSNCYADMWIETLHWLGLDPRPVLAAALACDFEGDQWTLFKPLPGDLFALYGIDVAELNAWRTLPEQITEQIAAGRLLTIEVDAFHLPDTAATSYHVRHQKSTILATAIDHGGRCLHYFHDAGYHVLADADYDQILTGDQADGIRLPPYVEIVKLDRLHVPSAAELRWRAAALAREHFERRPLANPYERAAERHDAVVGGLVTTRADFNDYLFAGLRQAGAASQYAAAMLQWLAAEFPGLASPAALFDELARGTHMMLLRTARTVRRRQTVATAPIWRDLARLWSRAVAALDVALPDRRKKREFPRER